MHRKRQIAVLALAGAAFVLWGLGLLEAVVLVLCSLAGAGAALTLITGALSVKIALGRAADWLGRRLAR